MADPGVLGSQVPPGDDEVWKQIKALEQATQQALAAAASAQALIGLAANQVVPQVNSGLSNSYVLTTAYQTVASFTFTTPAGYTKAVVSASGAATLLSNAASGEIGYVRILVGGNAGQEGRCLFLTTMDPSVSAFATQLFSGLTSGQTILVEIQAKLTNGPGFNLPVAESGSVTGMALFQK